MGRSPVGPLRCAGRFRSLVLLAYLSFQIDSDIERTEHTGRMEFKVVLEVSMPEVALYHSSLGVSEMHVRLFG